MLRELPSLRVLGIQQQRVVLLTEIGDIKIEEHCITGLGKVKYQLELDSQDSSRLIEESIRFIGGLNLPLIKKNVLVRPSETCLKCPLQVLSLTKYLPEIEISLT